MDIDISKINVRFGNGNELEDKYFSGLLGKAYRREVACHNATIPMVNIIPFSDYTPERNDKYRDRFNKKYRANRPPALYVYEKSGHFVMSDDYNAYFMYKEVKATLAICVVVGPHTITEGVEYGPAFHLKLPTFKVV